MLLYTALLVACPSAEVHDTAPLPVGNADADGDADTDTDADADGPTDTGIAYMFLVAEGGSDGVTWGGGTAGYSLWTPSTQASACDLIANWEPTGKTVPTKCPDCAWSFSLAWRDSKATGPECDDLYAAGFSDGSIDGVEWTWAWTDAFDFYGDGRLYTDETLLIYLNSGGYRGWYPMALNYGSLHQIDGTAESFRVSRQFYGYYYYFYR